MDLSTEYASRRGSYLAHFDEEGKELETQFERSPRSDGFPAVIVEATAAQSHHSLCSCVIISRQQNPPWFFGRIWILRVGHVGRPVAARTDLAPKRPEKIRRSRPN